MADLNMGVRELEAQARQCRIDIIEMLVEAGSGHPGGSLSSIDILIALYFNFMKHDPKNPNWEERDFFILSKGHVVPALYTALARAGYFPIDELKTLRKLGSRLQGHPGMNTGLPGIEVSSGSLGQGLGVAAGIALGLKTDGKTNHVWCLNGDGEMQEGSIWEAAMCAGHYKLENLTTIVDCNGLQIDGQVCNVMDIEPLDKKFESFNWNTVKCDGHNMSDILRACFEAGGFKGKPTAILAKTVKGKGVSFMENAAEWHGTAPDREKAKLALKELRMVD
ncbi:MAG: transketolase [Planctomycetota bacterium]|jgi:transketolase